MQSPILITGAARSGTSLTAGIIQICGAFGGETAPSTMYNRKGMFENCEVRQGLTKPYLQSIGCDPLGQKPLPSTHKIFSVTAKEGMEWGEAVKKIFIRQGYESGPWYYKGAKACLLWYMWHLAFPDAKWVIVRREENDIARSCMQTRFMRSYHDILGWLKWVDTHKKRFLQMEAAGLNIREVWPVKIIDGDSSEIKSVVEWLGLEWEEKMVGAFVDPSLYGGKK